MFYLFSELVEGLTRAQRRLEDQRGTEINFELPDFLKDKENHQNSQRHMPKLSESEGDTRFYLDMPENPSKFERSTLSVPIKRDKAAYENRSVMLPPDYSRTSPLQINMKITPSSTPSESSSNQSTPSKSTLNNTVIENKVQGRPSDPPPLPPKPKIVPIKPPNWGQLNGFRSRATDRTQAMFLEQPSSSFV